MQKYEVLFLTVPELTKDESANIESSIEKLISSHSGSIISHDRWGKYKLAYEVRGNEYGIYFLTRFELTDKAKLNTLEELKNLLAVKFNELIMRHVVVKLDKNTPLEYVRPESLEEAPTSKDVDQFLKENKMSGLISNNDGKSPDIDALDIEELED